MKGDTPYVFRGSQEDGYEILYSPRANAVLFPITIPAGFGVVQSGQVMGIITESTNRVGLHVPYPDVTPAAALTDVVGATYLTDDVSSGTDVYVTMDDSYRFAVGDHVAIADASTNDSSAEDLGAITAIDRTTYTHIAKITVTNSVSGSFTVANGVWIHIQSKTAAPYLQAKGILIGAVDTGIGENAKGGDGVLCMGGATFYKNMLVRYDSNVLTDLSGAEHGRYVILK